MGKDAQIVCGSCHCHWETSAAPSTEYFRGEIEGKPCPVCGAYTLAVSQTETPKRRGPVRSFHVPKRVATTVA
ncbi:MAG: hypothetical protein U0798_11010 [Gemmataceae bacterium]